MQQKLFIDRSHFLSANVVAFCFYNLSSILNGLVYFDQFDRLSAKQLCLVVLGICILLSGVWALSRQDEGDDEGCDGGKITTVNGDAREGGWSAGTADGEDMNVTPPSSPMGLFNRPLPGSEGRETTSSTKLANGRRVASSPATFPFPSSSSMPDTGSPTFPPADEDVGITSALIRQGHLSSPQTTQISPARRHARRSTVRFSSTLDPAGSGVGGEAGHVGPPLVGGFAIGLSPLSPGFSLAPRHRHRQDSEASQAGQQHGEGEGERGQRGTETNLVEDQSAKKRHGFVRRTWNDLRGVIRRDR